MSDLAELKKARLDKLNTLKKEGINPYPSKVKRTQTCKQADESFDEFVKKDKVITLAGRLISLREHGGLSFANLKDESGKFQLAFKKNTLGEDYKQLKKLDIGDFLEVTGKCFLTKLGQKTLSISKFTLISKSLRPLPEKWHGLKDQELRYRKRYLDLIMNEEAKKVFYLRSELIDSLRDFLTDRKFLEVETPILQQTFGGAVAKPFTTHHNALNTDFYLRIAPELYLKRLIVGGFEKVFEIGRIFRNEGISTAHNPDFTMLE
ncbi:amino acid--tRNA ligase-related protein, partial [Patescibacteria group bacterium]